MGAVADQQRSDIEAGFLSNAFIFFVGWSWVVVLRDATALVFLLSTLLTGGSQLVGVTAEVICGFMLGPVLTVVVVRWCTMAIIASKQRHSR